MTNWLRRMADHPDPRHRVICFPHAGGAVSAYREWRFPAWAAAQVWAVQLPGRENRWGETTITRTRAVIDALVPELNGLLDRPFTLFGHSMGALLAFELTRELRRRDLPTPNHLFVSGFRAPHLPPWRPAMSPLPDPEFLARLRAMDGAAILSDQDLLDLFGPLLRADFELCEFYEHNSEPPLALPITAFTATDDPEVRVDEVAKWRHHTTGPFALRVLTGGHLFVRSQAATILDEISGAISLLPRA